MSSSLLRLGMAVVTFGVANCQRSSVPSATDTAGGASSETGRDLPSSKVAPDRRSSQLAAGEGGAGGPHECMPVAGCNLFWGCEVAEPVGPESYRLLTFESHPQVVGQVVRAADLKWSVGGRAGSARALLTPLPCTATPSAQQPLTYRCQMAGERCVVIRPTSVEPK